ncbi:MAG: CoA protein activase [Dehalococcoidia bacterium]|nr:CoA protein activase [Dehalococcoidia bacterium]
MKVGFPHCGSAYIPAKAIARELAGGAELIVPPSNSKRSLSLGVKYAPEGLCIPFKLTLGNLIEVCELGADTIIHAGGAGICRLGHYAKTQEWILRDMGFDFQMLYFELSKRKLRDMMSLIKVASGGASWLRILLALRFGLVKLGVVDDLERMVHKIRPRELHKGTATGIYRQAVDAIDMAGSHAELKKIKADYVDRLRQIPLDPNADPLLVRIIGEIYVVLEPFANMDVEVELGKLGVEVRRHNYLSQWAKFSFFLNNIGVDENRKIHKAAMPYLKHDVGGDGWESVGEKVLCNDEYDGMVHLAPFTCMPETVAMNIMASTRENLPVLTILCDEQMGKAGMITRLEAFVDLLERKRRVSRKSEKLARV